MTSANPFITTDVLVRHWQGHRRLTRRVIEAFPEDRLFTFSIGGMRPFGEMAKELLAMAAPMAHGLATGEWRQYALEDVETKGELLRLWDESTERLEASWEAIPPERFGETITSFGQYEGPVHWQVLYVIDNEIHHRGQGYVYLRALEIEPPPFWERD
jgi:uncharacterized damage-inducible protein DinB